MQNVSSISAVAAASLFVVQAFLVLARTRACVRRLVSVLLAGFFASASLYVCLPRDSVLHEPVLFLLLWAAGAFLITASNGRMFGMWTGAIVTLFLSLLIARLLGHASSVPYRAFRCFGITLLAALPLGILLRFWRKKNSLSAFLTFVAGTLWLSGDGIELVSGLVFADSEPVVAVPELFLSLCTGWLVFQEGYPDRTSLGGSLPALTRKEGLMHSLHTRLLATERALVGHERVTTAGFLALGAAHEFKNILSLVRLAARHGLTREDPADKDDCLRLIVEHTNTARSSAIEVLERVASTGGDEACALDAARDFTGTVRRAGAALRGEGIVIEADLEAGVAFRARRFDVEQIILNLIHNAAESYRRCPREETHTIRVVAKAEDECAVIEVRDSAGGVAESVRYRLFTPALSGPEGGGLGLYLSRNLAIANGGTLDFQPLVGGSSFVLALPAAYGGDEPGPQIPGK